MIVRGMMIRMMKFLYVLVLTCGMNIVLAMEEPVTPPAAPSTMVKIQGTDGEQIEVPLEIANLSSTIKNMLDDLAEGGVVDVAIPVTNIKEAILNKILGILKLYHEFPTKEVPENVVKEINSFDMDMLIKIANGANYLAVPDKILSALGKRIAEKFDDYKTYLMPHDKEELPEDFFKEYVSPSLMVPIINQIKMKVLKDSSEQRCKLLFKASDSHLDVSMGLKYMQKDQWLLLNGKRARLNNNGLEIYDIGLRQFIQQLDLGAAGLIREIVLYEGKEKKYIAVANVNPSSLDILNVSNINNIKICKINSTLESIKSIIERPVISRAFNKDGTRLAVSYYGANEFEDNKILVWNIDKIRWEDENPILNEEDCEQLLLDEQYKKGGVRQLFIEDHNCYIIYTEENQIRLLTCDTMLSALSEDVIVTSGVETFHKATFNITGKKIAVLLTDNQKKNKVIVYDRDAKKISSDIDVKIQQTIKLSLNFIDDHLLTFFSFGSGITIIDIFNNKPQHFLGNFLFSEMCCGEDGIRIIFLGIKIPPISFHGEINKLFGYPAISVDQSMFNVFLWDMFEEMENSAFEKMRKATIEQVTLIHNILSGQQSTWATLTSFNKILDSLDKAIGDILKKYYPEAIAKLSSMIIAYEKQYLPQVEERPFKAPRESLNKAGQSLLLKKSIQQKQIPQEPIQPQSIQQKPVQQKTWWKERLQSIASGARDALNAIYQYMMKPKTQ